MKKKKLKSVLLSIAGLLAVMGLMFTWKCPVDCIFGVDSGVFFFKKQLLWNVIGIAAYAGAALIPWRKWLKLAPWGMLAWFALAVWAFGFSPARHGSHGWADFGVVCVNISDRVPDTILNGMKSAQRRQPAQVFVRPACIGFVRSQPFADRS